VTAPALASPLAAPALSLLEDGATASVLVARFAGLGAVIEETTAERLLDQLADLGLVRVTRGAGARRVFVTTSLGQRSGGVLSGAVDEAAGLLRDLEEMRADLLSTIAHELRTPLTVIRTSVGLLRDPDTQPSPEQHLALLDTIERSADRMQRLVTDTLDLTRFRAGRISLQLRRFDAIALARAVVASLAPGSAARVDLHAPPIPVWVFGDRRRLDQALLNLVSNALKYSPAETRVRLSVTQQPPEVHWEVADQGPGIPPEERGRLFERFFVGRNDRSRTRDGVGLGLPIALAIAQAHGGRIDVESEPDVGSRFTMVVPADGPHGLDQR
jgi:signal transduction histidine kinase